MYQELKLMIVVLIKTIFWQRHIYGIPFSYGQRVNTLVIKKYIFIFPNLTSIINIPIPRERKGHVRCILPSKEVAPWHWASHGWFLTVPGMLEQTLTQTLDIRRVVNIQETVQGMLETNHGSLHLNVREITVCSLYLSESSADIDVLQTLR